MNKPLYTPHFRLVQVNGLNRVAHNCNGDLNFSVETILGEETARLIELAIEEGKRQRSQEINALLRDI